MTRWVVVAASVLLAGGCSSSPDEAGTAATTAETPSADTTVPSTDSGEPEADESTTGRSAGEVTLLDAGAEPRFPLAIATDARSRLSVDASDALALTIGDVTTDDGAAAGYDLDLVLTSGDAGAELLVVPTSLSFDGSAPATSPAPDELGTWRWFLDRNGRVQRVVAIGWSDRVDADTLELLSVAHLVLVAPAEPVGAGAVWSQSLDRQSDARLVFTLIEVTDTDLEVAVELVAPFEEGVATMVASGTYDRATLLAREVTTESSLEITSPVTDNGELVELTGVQRSRRTYSEASG